MMNPTLRARLKQALKTEFPPSKDDLREVIATLSTLEAERDALKAESESRRNKLLAVSDERRAEWIRAENAEGTLAALRAKVEGLCESEAGGSMDSRGYNAAIDAVLALITERA